MLLQITNIESDIWIMKLTIFIKLLRAVSNAIFRSVAVAGKISTGIEHRVVARYSCAALDHVLPLMLDL